MSLSKLQKIEDRKPYMPVHWVMKELEMAYGLNNNNKDLLYSNRDSTQSFVVTHMEKGSERSGYVYN